MEQKNLFDCEQFVRHAEKDGEKIFSRAESDIFDSLILHANNKNKSKLYETYVSRKYIMQKISLKDEKNYKKAIKKFVEWELIEHLTSYKNKENKYIAFKCPDIAKQFTYFAQKNILDIEKIEKIKNESSYKIEKENEDPKQYVSKANIEKKKEKRKKLEEVDKKLKNKYIELSNNFYDYIDEEYGNISKDFKKSEEKVIKGAKVVKKLIELDGYEIEKLKDILIFGLKNDFWKAHLKSLNNLRKISKNGNKKITNLYNAYELNKKIIRSYYAKY